MFLLLHVFIAVISFGSNVVSYEFQQKALDECGIKKGCIFHPDGCKPPKCLLALTYNFTGEVIEYEISSFLKENLPNRYIAIGFSDDQEMMHMTLNTTGSLLIAVSFICVFIAENGKWTGKNFPKGTHAILGMTASIGAFLQPIMGIYRCTPKHKLRILFNCAHAILGYGSFICAAASIWCVTYPPFSYKLGVNEDYGIVPRSLIIIFWVIIVITAITLETLSILKNQLKLYNTNAKYNYLQRVQLATVIGFILIALIFVSGLVYIIAA
ncbi:putative ferric-chelate reductase 1 [Trichinella spiralis]|uniref:putative ferric-chelate reductase 1 n=1 Tax=Trichinella spiralis TaxID=6334 RepID=UPI0001EFD382|nr:putative ferric-chelate reductase 1 [Trichinella spiralis]